MEKVKFTSGMVRELRGAPLSCLILMAMAGQAVSAQYLERSSGYSDKVVSAALLYLQDQGYITRNERYSWRIAINVSQLPLMTLSDENEPYIQPQVVESVQQEPNIEITDATRNNSESENIRVVTSSSSIDLTSRELIDLPLLDSADPENLRVADNLAACDRFGIGEPKRSVISKLKHVNSRMIHFHCAEVLAAGYRIGAAIKRLEKGWKVPDDWISPSEKVDYSEYLNPVNVCAQTFSSDDLDLWEATLESVRSDFKTVEFETWLKSAKLFSVDGDGWTIRVGNRYAADWIKEHALGALQSAAGVNIKVVY